MKFRVKQDKFNHHLYYVRVYIDGMWKEVGSFQCETIGKAKVIDEARRIAAEHKAKVEFKPWGTEFEI